MRLKLSILACFLLAIYTVVIQAQATSIVGGTGQIAYLGRDGNIYIYDVVQNDTQAVTQDASAVGGTPIIRYQWPTWSTDGRLAYFAGVLEQGLFSTQVFVRDGQLGTSELIYEGANEYFNYASWAPQNCTQSIECRELAILFSNLREGGLFVQVVKDAVQDFPHRTIGRGGPFYYSWSPNGQAMFWQRNNQRLDVYSLTDDTISATLPSRAGMFSAPHWSPIDQEILFGKSTDTNNTTALAIWDGEQERVLLDDLRGMIWFAWSPDGRYVAFVDARSTLYVLDAQNGEVISRTLQSGVGAFFWSPDSQKIAFITRAAPLGAFSASSGLRLRFAQENEILLNWSTLNVNDGAVTVHSTFNPTADMVYMFLYFDQFSQSHRVWSTDSRYLVYSEVSPSGAIISIIDTQQPNAVPMMIAEGSLAVWSFN